MQILHALCQSQHCLILPDPQRSSTRAILLMRQKEYKLAALKAKQQGDLEKAKEYMRAGKVCTQEIPKSEHTSAVPTCIKCFVAAVKPWTDQNKSSVLFFLY